jgi:hypothetical protein
MTARTPTILKTYFETGDKPTQTQFGDLIDSFVNVATSATQTPIGPLALTDGSTVATASAADNSTKMANTSFVRTYVSAAAIAGTKDSFAYQNGFTNAGGGYDTGAYYRTNNGIVYLQGLVSCPANPNTKIIATLASGYRPLNSCIFSCYASFNGTISVGSVIVNTIGEVYYFGSNSATNISLNGLNFTVNAYSSA